jgi:simple sugar transport system permease protein
MSANLQGVFGRRAVIRFFPYIVAVIGAMLTVGILLLLLGFDPLRAYETILLTSFRTQNGFIQTLQKFVPLVLLALAYTIPISAGKFNIGGDGQMIMGATVAAIIGITLKGLPMLILLPMTLVGGIIGGGLWALLPAWLLYRFNISEVLGTVLMNFVSYQVLDYVATALFPEPQGGHPMTVELGAGASLPLILRRPDLHSGIVIALIIALAAYVFIERSAAGYELMATGSNPRAAKVFGINTRLLFMLALVLGGAVAGLAGAIETTGVQHRLTEGFNSNFFQLGMIIGLISRANHVAVPFVAFFIAVLEVGASAMQRTLGIPVEMVFIIEALILVFVLVSDVVRRK